MNTLGIIPIVQAQNFHLPAPGDRVHLSTLFNPPILKGLKIHPENPLRFDFILDRGDEQNRHPEQSEGSQQEQLKVETTKLIKYFLASLTIPEKDLWVNLSPYEKERIIPSGFGLTEMGRDLLAEDYMLKQITASLIYPEDEIGKKFWKRIYQEAFQRYGTTNIPVNTFNKVWIVPEKAVVYENAKTGVAYVVESKLRVMLEQDYLSLQKHQGQRDDVNALGSQVVREIIIPELTKEVNEGKNFIQLRQIYNSMILAAWFKVNLKESLLGKIYVDRDKTEGIDIKDKIVNQRIYKQYLVAFKKGVFNLIKEEADPSSDKTIARKYFSGGFMGAQMPDGASFIGEVASKTHQIGSGDVSKIAETFTGNAAMVTVDLAENEVEKEIDQLRLIGEFNLRQRMDAFESIKTLAFSKNETVAKEAYRYLRGMAEAGHVPSIKALGEIGEEENPIGEAKLEGESGIIPDLVRIFDGYGKQSNGQYDYWKGRIERGEALKQLADVVEGEYTSADTVRYIIRKTVMVMKISQVGEEEKGYFLSALKRAIPRLIGKLIEEALLENPTRPLLSINDQGEEVGVISDLVFYFNNSMNLAEEFEQKEILRTLVQVLDRESTDTAVLEYVYQHLKMDTVRKYPDVAVVQEVYDLVNKGNKDADENKRVNADVFVTTHWVTIGRLRHWNRRYAQQIFTNIMDTLGPVRLDAFLNDIKEGFNNETMYKSVNVLFKNLADKDFVFAQRILELVTTYRNLELTDLFDATIASSIEGKNLSTRAAYLILAQELMKAFAEKLEISSDKINAESINNWYLPYLSKLFVARERLKTKYPQYPILQEVFDVIIKSTMENQFSLMITDTSESNPYGQTGRMIAFHNQKVRNALRSLGIDAEAWLNYLEEDRFEFEEENKKDMMQLNLFAELKNLNESLINLLDVLPDNRRTAFLNALKNVGYEFIDDEKGKRLVKINGKSDLRRIHEVMAFLKPIFVETNSLYKTLRFLYKKYLPETISAEGVVLQENTVPEDDEVHKIRVALDHFKDKFDRLEDIVRHPEKYKEALRERPSFVARVWKRNPGRDIFQGNFTACCVAIDSTINPVGILEYLVDQGIQIVEIVDEATDMTIAQGWVFVGKDEHKNPVLIIDNIEVVSDYPAGTKENNLIRDKLINYVKNYAHKVGAKGLYLGSTQYNDVDTSEFSRVTDRLAKAGGYIWEKVEKGYTAYLEALFGESVGPHPVAEDGTIWSTVEDIFTIPLPVVETPKANPETTVTRLTPEQTQANILELSDAEAASYENEQLITGRGYMERVLKNPKAINMVLKQGDRIIGYVLALPSEDESTAPQISNSLYITDFTILPQYRNNPRNMSKLIQGFIKVAKTEYETITLHTHGKIPDLMEKKLGFRKTKLESNWLGSGVDFWEMRWDRNPVERTEPQSEEDQGHADSAMKGGIDFTSANLNLQIKRDAKGIPLLMSKQSIENIHINGFVPIIIYIQPIKDLRGFIASSASIS